MIIEDILNILLAIGILFCIGFIIAFPIISLWYLFKFKKLKKYVPEKLKGGIEQNGNIKKEEEITEDRGGRGGGRIRRELGRGIRGGGRELEREEIVSRGREEGFGKRDPGHAIKRSVKADWKSQIQPTPPLERVEREYEGDESDIDEDWENLA
jgi:hypothetical protein